MNILPAVVVEGGGLRLPEGTVVPVRRSGLPETGAGVLLGVRPEHLAGRVSGEGEPGLIATVRAVERLGADAYAHCQIPGVTDPAGADLVVRLPGNAAVAPGERISATIEEASAHLFDPGTGRRLAAR